MYNICTSYESTSSEDFKNIFVIEIGLLNWKLAYLCNLSGQNDQFRFQKSNMVMWHIKLKLEAHRTFWNFCSLKMKFIASVILENHFFRKFYRWRHNHPYRLRCLQKLLQGHKMAICTISIAFHYGLGILNQMGTINNSKRFRRIRCFYHCWWWVLNLTPNL